MLIIALIFLVVLTLLSLSTSQTTVMDERMTSNSKDRQLALQATEAATRDAESLLESFVSIAAFTGTGGLLRTMDAEPNYLDATQWTSTHSMAYRQTIAGVAAQPRFIIKMVGEIVPLSNTKSLNIGGYGQQGGGKTYGFRITARGSGGTGTAAAVIQCDYGKAF
ncbi:MAG: hypothetical protein HQL87_04135 [Magnetococcales bacterium]|nr:hypothetical protein [Magnetococcales bacterium]